MSPLRSLPGRPAYPSIDTEYEHQLEMVRPSTARVEVPPVPEGYLLRQFRAGDEAEYDNLFHLAFADEGRFPQMLEGVLEGGFYVIEHLATGHLVASGQAWRGSTMPRHPDAGQMGWLVTDPSHAGKGLGTIAAASATNRLATVGYQRPCLGTEDFRITAISIYLKLGWVPYIYREDLVPRSARHLHSPSARVRPLRVPAMTHSVASVACCRSRPSSVGQGLVPCHSLRRQ